MATDQPAGPLRRRILLPSFLAALLPFALVGLPPGHWRLAPLLLAGGLTALIAGIALAAPWPRLPGWGPSALSFAYLVVVALLRDAGGPSGVAPVVLLPVFWIAVCGTARQLVVLVAGVAVVLVLPVVVVGGPAYPPATWRAALLFIAVSALVGWTIQSLVAHVRAQELSRRTLLQQLDHLAHTDGLTLLPNRRAWDAELDRALARARRTGEPLTLALIDVDGLKAINDLRGHPAGDSLLMEVARAWPGLLRPDDCLARIGGDEFAVLLPSCDQTESASIIERLRREVPFPHSCSVGLATWDGAETPARIMRRADDALYLAKREGRNRAVAV